MPLTNKEYSKLWYKKNRDKIIARSKEYMRRPEVKKRASIAGFKKKYGEFWEAAYLAHKVHRKLLETVGQEKLEKIKNKAYGERPEVKRRAKERSRRPEYREKQKVYCLKNKEKIRKHLKEYVRRPDVRARRREYLKEYNKEYFKRPDIKKKNKIRCKKYYNKNREKLIEYSKKYQKENKEKIIERLRRPESREHKRIYQIEWRKRPEYSNKKIIYAERGKIRKKEYYKKIKINGVNMK